ncbi:MAG: PEP-CTERM sorting domain-containing protein [Fimbriimonadaceae bacterium]
MCRLVFALASLAACLVASANPLYVYMPDSTNNRLVLFDPFNGDVVNPNYFALAGGTPFHAIQVGNEIWVSEQVGDRVSRWSLTGTPLGAITGALDNIRGMALVDSTVYVANSGTLNSAPGAAIRMFSTTGADLGHFATPASGSPFAILGFQGGLLVASSTANDDVHRYSLTGVSQGTFHNSTNLNFAQQMAIAANGDVLVAGFSSNNIVRLDPTTGSLISSFPASGARGVFQLGNGNILWSSGAGAHIYDVTLGTSTLIYSGGGRHFGLGAVPEPGTMLALAAGLGAIGIRRRRKR